MSVNVRRHAKLLDFLRVLPPKVRKTVLKSADNSLILVLCEIALNFCMGNIRCEKRLYNKLRKHKKSLYKLASARRDQKHFKKERVVLNQQGGAFLPLLLAPVLSTLAQYLVNRQGQ
jgi:hypothetical protein